MSWAAARSPGPVYNTSRELGDSGPCAQPPHRPDRRPHVTTLAAAYALHAAGAGLPPPPVHSSGRGGRQVAATIMNI
jgi:hypothetical protein